ncbi:MAG: type II toxin-antitoxin system VapC family toxin [Candidatus Electrothrix sp. LOE1_4_5]|nr:type II toxin-antitoxin system VapC family toxin [Candidatus Electrothrix gigas]
MNYLLDTCVISELVKPRPNTAVTDWLARIPADRLFLCSLTIGELKRGIMRLTDSKKKNRLMMWLETLLADYGDRILPVDRAVAEAWGIMQARAEDSGQRMSIIDGYIAATASAYQMTVVTRNEGDFSPSHQAILNPWKML